MYAPVIPVTTYMLLIYSTTHPSLPAFLGSAALSPHAEGVADVQVMLRLQSVPEYLQASRAALFAFSSLPRLLNMKVCRGLTSCMAETRSSDALTMPSMMCNTAASTVLADVCTLIGCNTDIIYHSSHGAAILHQDHAQAKQQYRTGY